MSIRKFLIGDIHGNLDELLALEKHIQSECEKAGDDYRIICTGDIMNGGPKSYELFKYVQKHPKFTLILGNNDEFFCSGKIEDNTFYNMGIADAFSCNKASGVTETFQNILNFYNQENKPFFGYSPNPNTPPFYKKSLDPISCFNAIFVYEKFFKQELEKPENQHLSVNIKKTCENLRAVMTAEYKAPSSSPPGWEKRWHRYGTWSDTTADYYQTHKKEIESMRGKMATGIYGRTRMNDDSAFKDYIIEGKPTGEGISRRAYDDRAMECIVFLANVFEEMKQEFEKCPIARTLESNQTNYYLSHSGGFSNQVDYKPNDPILAQYRDIHADTMYLEGGSGWGDEEVWGSNYNKTNATENLWSRGHGKQGASDGKPVRDESNAIKGFVTVNGHVPRDENYGSQVCSFDYAGRLVSVNLDGGAKGMEKAGSSVIRCFEPQSETFYTVDKDKEIIQNTVEDYRQKYALQKTFGSTAFPTNVREGIKKTLANNKHAGDGGRS